MQLYLLDFLPLIFAFSLIVSVFTALDGYLLPCRLAFLPSAVGLSASAIGLKPRVSAALFAAFFIICASAAFMRNTTTK